jgi:predicted permease
MGLRDDFRYALRSLAGARLTVAVLVLSFAAGTGANAVLYTAMNALILRPAPGIVRPGRLVSVFTSGFNGGTNGLSSYPDALSLAQGVPALSSLAPFDDSAIELVRLDTTSQRIRVVRAGESFFPTLGIEPVLGQLPRSGDRRAAVISFDLWTNFGQPADVIGKHVLIGARDDVVAAVLPRGFRGLRLDRAWDLWIPLDVEARGSRGDRRLSLLGRLAPGAAIGDAQRQANDVAARLADAFPATNRGTRTGAGEPRKMAVVPFSRVDPTSTRRYALLGLIVLGAAAMLLVSACVNAALLLTSRSAARRRELAVKVALGASRATLVRQAFTESLLIAIGGAAVGLLFAYWTAGILPSRLMSEEAQMLDTHLDAATVIVTTLFAFAAAAAFTIGPARHATSTIDIDVLRADSGNVSASGGRGKVRGFVVAGQIALSTVLLISAGLLVRALSAALDGDLSQSVTNLAIANVKAPGAETGKVVLWIGFQDAALPAVRKIPGVESAAWVTTLPVRKSPSLRFEIAAAPGLIETAETDTNITSPGYFDTMRIPLLEGRLFDERDAALAPPVVVINDILARRYFGSSAAGRTLRDPDGSVCEIVGVVGSGKYRTFQDEPEPTVYFPISQRRTAVMHMIVRTAGRAAAVLPPLRERLLSVGDGATVEWTMTFQDHLSNTLIIDRVLTTIVGACAILALALATLGVHGVMSDAVRRRTPEIGLRLALGARRRQVAALVFGEGVYLTAAGGIAGTVTAVVLARIVRSFTSGVPLPDMLGVAIVAAMMMLVALAGALVPTWRALRISPTVALRAE